MIWAMATILTVSSLAGILLAPSLVRQENVRRLSLAFATGTLLAVVTAHVMPESLSGEHGALFFLLGFVGMMLLHQHVLKSDPCCGHNHIQHAGLPSFLALGLCALNDGILLIGDAEAGLSSPLLWSLAAHKATAGFALFLLLREISKQDVKRRTLYLGAYILISPLTFILGGELGGELAGYMPQVLGIAGGALLYAVAGSMVPQVEHMARESFGPILGSFLLGIALTVGMTLVVPHVHGGGHSHGKTAPEAHSHEHGDDEHSHR